MTLQLRSLTRWFRPRGRRSIPLAPAFAKPKLLVLEDRIAPSIGFKGTDTQDQLNLLLGAAAGPPNAMAAVGPNYIVENLNGSFAVYDKLGNLQQAKTGDAFFDPGYTGSDPIHFFDTRILYDRNSGHWFALATIRPVGNAPNDVQLAVSQTSDPTGAWYRYTLPLGESGGTTDYPTLGVDSNGVYVGISILSSTGAYVKAKIAALPLAPLLTGTLSTVTQFDLGTSMFSTPQPAYDFDPVPGATNYTPSGPMWFVASAPGNTTGLVYCTVHWNVGGTAGISAVTPLAGTMIPVGDPSSVLGITNFGTQIGGAPALGDTSNPLHIETGDRRLLMAVVRNGELWTTRTVATNQNVTPGNPDRDGAEWFKLAIDNLTQAATLADSGLVSDTANNGNASPMFYYYPSLIVTGQGNMRIGFSGSSTTTWIGAYATGRLATAPAGQTDAVGVPLQGGLHSFNQLTAGRKRWGDFSFTSLDPVDDMTAWTTQEYAEAPSSYNNTTYDSYGTYISSFNNPGITLINPIATVKQGKTGATVNVTGAWFHDFLDPFTGASAYTHHMRATISGTGISSVRVVFTDSGHAKVIFNIAADATLGLRDLTLINPDGQSAFVANAITIVVNQVPVLDNIETAALAYTENDPATPITGSITVTDPDNTSLAGAYVTITGGFQSNQDVLSFTNTASIHGSYSTGVLTLSNATSTPADLATWQAALQAVKYSNTSDNPDTTTRTISFVVDDGEPASNLSNTQMRDITITAVNDPPVLAGLETTNLNYAIGSAAIGLTSTLTVSDPDNATLARAIVSITPATYDAGNDILALPAQIHITATFANGVLTLTGDAVATLTDFQTALRAVTFVDTTGFSGASRVITFQADDGQSANNLSNTVTRTITVTVPPASVQGTVWHDANGDGIRQTGDDPVQGAVVELFNATTSASLGIQVTGAGGSYQFSSVPFSTMLYVQVRPPVGMGYTLENQGTDPTADSDIDAATGQTASFSVLANTTTTLDGGLTNNPPGFGFALTAGGVNADAGSAVAVDSDGNVIVAGKITGAVDFDSGPGTYNLSANGTNAVVAKYTPVGALIWARVFASSTNTDPGAALGVTVDSNKRIIVAGYFSGTVDFDRGTGAQTLTSSGGEDGFVVKLDRNGNFVFAQKLGGSNDDRAQAVAVDSSDRIYLTGFETVGTLQRAFVDRLTANGGLDYGVTTGDTGTSIGHGIAADGNGNAFVTGSFTGTVDFDPSNGTSTKTSNGGTDVFVWKLDSSHALSLIETVGDSGNDSGNAITLDGSGNMFIAGSFEGRVDFRTNGGDHRYLTSAGGTDAFVWKLNSSGNDQLAVRFGGSGDDAANGIDLGPNGQIFATGGFQNSAAVTLASGQSLTLQSAGSDDVFVARLNSAGRYVSVLRTGGTQSDVGSAIAVDAAGATHVAGSLASNSADFDPSPGGSFPLGSAGSADLFLWKVVANLPPTANAGGPYTVAEGSSLALDASASTDPEGDPLTYSWDVNGDGTFGDATGVNPTLSWATLHNTLGITDGGTVYRVKVRVSDDHGHTTTSSAVNLTVTDPAPSLDLSSNAGTVNEGATYTLNLGTITDPANDSYTGAVIHWGDGTPNTTITADPTNAIRTHTYADGPNDYTITVDLNEAVDSHTGVGSKAVHVNNVPPTIALTGNANTDEGSSYMLNLGAVSQPGNDDTIIAYTIHWGDGHSDNFIGNPTNDGIQSHTYNDGPNDYTITVDLTDDDGTHANAGSLAVHVNNVAPTIALSGSANVDEGSTYTLTLGAISEPGNDGDAITAYTIHWGDGKPDITGSGNPPGTATHVYDNGPNNYTITVDLTDDDGAHTGNGSQAVHVNEVPPTIALSDNTVGTQIGQGSTYILTLGTVTDPGTDAGDQVTTWTVHWDDGSSAEPFTSGGDKTHVYHAPGPYLPTVDLTNGDGTYTNTGNPLTVNVFYVPPTILVSGDSHTLEGSVYTVTLGPFTNPYYYFTVDGYTIDWGDGHSDVSTSGLPFLGTVTATHTYNDGTITHNIDVGLHDDHGQHTGSGSTQVTVDNVPPTIVLSGNANVDEGSTYTLNLGAITEPGNDGDVPTAYTIHWGDGHSDSFTSNPTADGSQTHTYNDGPNDYTITIDLTDDDGAHTNAGSQAVHINNVPPIIALSGNANVAEGSTYTLNLGAVSEPGHDDTITAYTIHWGDGQSDSFTSDPTTDGSRTHIYADGPNDYTITVDLTDDDGTHANAGSRGVHVNDVPPTIALSGNAHAVEGSSYTLTLGPITDPGLIDQHTAYAIHWGDGQTDSFTGDPTGAIKTHVYNNDKPSSVTITVDLTGDDGTFTNAGSKPITVDNVPPTIQIVGGTMVNEGSTYTLTLGAMTDAGHDDTVTAWIVHWGDGLTNTYASGGTKTHVFDDGPSTPAITVDLTDDDGTHLNTANPLSVTVKNVAPTATFSTPPGIKIKNRPVSFSFSNQFDPSHADTVAGFRYFFDFNNNGSFTDPGDINGISSATATFRFRHEGTFTVHGRIQDKDSGFTDYYTTVTVIDTDLVVVGTDAGVQGAVRAYDAATGALKYNFTPFPGFNGGVRVAQGDVTGDGYPEIIVSAGPGGGPAVKVYDGKTGATLYSFFAYAPTFTGGIFIAAGDVNGDGFADVIVGADQGGGPHVKVIDGTKLNQVGANGVILDSALLYQFMAYAPTFTGGIRVAAADVNGDGNADLILGAGVTGGPHVRVFDGKNLGLLLSFMAFDTTYTGGIFVSGGDIDGDDRADIVVSQGQGNSALVRTFSGFDGHLMGTITPFPFVPNPFAPTPNPNGVRVLAVDRDGDGLADVVVAAGPGYPGKVRTYKGTTLQQLSEITPYDPGFLGGVFVG